MRKLTYSFLQRFNHSISSRYNYRIISNERIKPNDLSESNYHPIEAAYYSENCTFLTRIPLEKCRILHSAAFRCQREAENPLVKTLLDYQKGVGDNFKNSSLRTFYDYWHPRNASEVLGIDSKKLLKFPSLGFVFPWEAATPDQKRRYLKTAIQRDSGQFKTQVSFEDGWKGWGPVSDEVGKLEFRRLIDVHSSIKEHGYIRSDEDDGDMVGKLLSSEGEYRVMIMPGHHRAAALTALGYDEAIVRFHHPVIQRKDHKFWPHVRSGLYSEQEALQVFDRVFEGRQPWVEK